MSAVPMKSRTEHIVDPSAGYTEFDLTDDFGYGQWLGMFQELGEPSRLFNAYMIQNSIMNVQISSSPVHLHLFHRGIYVAPPFEYEAYYVEIPRSTLLTGRVYYRIPEVLQNTSLEGHKPALDNLLALDIWSLQEGSKQIVYSFYYEANIQTEFRDYQIRPFSEDQIRHYKGTAKNQLQ
ncbi:hypothetical protein LLE49_24465 [Alicyclobacillus tolerans]|uniref:hypothetical protein n=1 Tax=Alicyclobacillus tolerans TaxID=90970 RepID=UPI001F2851ED|nr:hypothetical protein [Alicyclobacillus tolerans]MCF8567880.1 hypothetical protein [Alicyclobacillus tolerans]